MKLRIYLILCACWAAFSLQAQEDSLRATRYVMRSVLYGAGMSNVLDTYLSPLEYKGPEIRILRENMRPSRKHAYDPVNERKRIGTESVAGQCIVHA